MLCGHMNRSTLLAALLLVLVAAMFGPHAGFALDLGGPGLSLPEQLAPRVNEPVGNPQVARILLIATAVFLLLWRRGVGQGPILALLPALAVVFHPAMYAAGVTPSAWLELGCFLLAALGAWLLTFERSAWSVVGAVLGFVAVLLAPSGAPLAAFVAFALAEAEPGLPGASVFASLYGVARALGLPTPLHFVPALSEYTAPLVPSAPDAAAATGVAEWGRQFLDWMVATASALLPQRVDLAVTHGSVAGSTAWIGAALLGFLVLAAFLLPAEKRFGGRAAAFFTFLSLVMLALIEMRVGQEDSVVLISTVALFTTWIAATADLVNSHPVRKVLAVGLAVGVLAGLGFARFTYGPAIDSRAAFLRQLATGPLTYPRDPLERRVLRERFSIAEPESIATLARSALERTPATWSPNRDRDLAVACALIGRPELGAQLVQRSLATPHPEFEADPELRNALRALQMDLMLRSGRSGDVVSWADELLAKASGAEVARWSVPKAAAHLNLAFAGSTSATERDAALKAAVATLDRAVEADPSSARARFDRGRLAMARGDGIGALKDLEKAVELRPDAVGPQLQLAIFYLSRAQESTALAAYERGKALADPDDAELQLFEAQRAAAKGDLAAAKKIAETLEARAPRLLGGASAVGDLHALIATVAEEQKNDGLALESCRAALRLRDDRNGDLARQLARILKRTLGHEELIAHLKDVKAREVPFPEVDLELSLALKNSGMSCLNGDRPKALERFLAAIAASPNYSELGIAPLLARNLTDELKASRDPLMEQAQRAYEFGIAQLRTDAATGTRALEVSLTLLPGNAYAAFQLGLLRKQANDREGARNLFRQALDSAKELKIDALVASIEQELNTLGSN